MAILQAARKHALDLVYPPRCAGCGRFGDGFFCSRCLDGAVPAIGPGRCPNCCAPWEEELSCPLCYQWDALDGARSAFVHEGSARRAVHALKYERVRAVAAPMGPALAQLAASLDAELAFAVPLHPSRRRDRGYNQSEELLRKAGLVAGEGSLVRTRKTKSQVGLALAARRSNVGGAFVYRGPELAEAKILVIDDVITTGATANECARVLKDHGAREVIAVSFTRATPHSGGAGGDV